jgi:hypothetical protein
MDRDLPGWVPALVVLALGIALSGVADFALTHAGYPALATLVWVAGYAGTLIVLWAGWFRHLEFTGPSGE